jgi:GDP-L-fucose synthase
LGKGTEPWTDYSRNAGGEWIKMAVWKDKRILVTGGAGFLGRQVTDILINEKGVAPEDILVPRRNEFDLRVWENCRKVVKGVDLVIHLAANVGGIGYNQKKPGELFYDNAIMGIQMIEASRIEGVPKFVALGTICAYPKFTPIPFKEEDLWNGYPEETNAPYGLAKKMMLVQSQSYREQYGYNSIFLLPVNLYGPWDNFDPRSSHVIPAIVKKVFDAQQKGEKKIMLWGTGKASREFLYVKDAAEGIVLAAERYNGKEPVNLGAGMEISIKDLAETIIDVFGFDCSIEWDPSKPDGQPRRSLDTSLAEKAFGFKAHTNFRSGLEETVDWYRKTGSKIFDNVDSESGEPLSSRCTGGSNAKRQT